MKSQQANTHQQPRMKLPSRSTTARMKSVGQRNTPPELALRRELHSLGLRFRVQYHIVGSTRRTADIAFPRYKIAVFVDGCFWHGCPKHMTWPKRNAQWWREKIKATKCRDTSSDAMLKAKGWLPIRVWEHEDPARAAERIANKVRQRSPAIKSGRDL